MSDTLITMGDANFPQRALAFFTDWQSHGGRMMQVSVRGQLRPDTEGKTRRIVSIAIGDGEESTEHLFSIAEARTLADYIELRLLAQAKAADLAETLASLIVALRGVADKVAAAPMREIMQ